MHDRRGLVWTGDDEGGYVGSVNGIQFYKVRTVLHAPGPRRKDERPKYLFLTRRLNTRNYEAFNGASRVDTADEAKAQCEVDYTRSGRAALHKTLGHALTIVEALSFRVSKPTLDDALAVVKAAGFCVSKLKTPKPKTPKRKNQVGPTFVAVFENGETTRMSTYTSLANLDLGRGLRLSRAAYEARARRRFGGSLHPVPPPIVRAHFEQDGNVLATYNDRDCGRLV
jgi:hypothetical protein